MKPRAYYEAIATLTGCIIGAGVLGIPYVVLRAGFWTGMLVLGVLGVCILLLHLMIGEIALRTNACHQLVGYAEKYLGKRGRNLMLLSMIIGVYGALTAYTIGIGNSLSILFGGPIWMWMSVYYLLMSLILFQGIGWLGRSELGFESLKFGVFVLLALILFASPYFSNVYFSGFSFERLLLPYGVILFAFLGTAAIPELHEQMRGCRLLTKRAILIGSLIPLVCYILFTIAVIGVSGPLTTQVATIGLLRFTGVAGSILLNAFAILAMGSSFLALGYALRESYQDLGVPKWDAWALALAVPIVLLLIGVESFVRTLEVTGTFAGGITGILIVLMHWKASTSGERKPEYRIPSNWLLYGALIGVFAVGMAYELILLV
ncbi:hypothetical protein J4219_02090 [Candidatus Woesearchaeota archaeon]|nr:hypothetical protein [Candidatus Woesearchaeota archaeon]